MKKENEISHVHLTEKKVGVINRDVFVFTFFLLLSFVFWYLNSLGKIVEADIKYPFKYINLPREKKIVQESPVKIIINLKGPGFSLLKLKLTGDKDPLLIDISKVTYKRVTGSKNLNYYIITSGITKSLSIQLRSGCEITSIKPDTLFFTLEKEISKSDSFAPERKVADVSIKNNLTAMKMLNE